MCVNCYLRKCFQIYFISIATDKEYMTDTVESEKETSKIKTHHKSHPGKNKNLSSLIFMAYVFSVI